MQHERYFYNWLARSVPQTWHVQRIESSTSNGIPDLNICADGIEFWWELKAGTKFPELRPGQWAWLNRRALAGGNVGVLHRQVGGLPWFLHGIRNCRTEKTSDKIRIVSPAMATGYTVDTLEQAVRKFYTPTPHARITD